jgi:hypothetical protein
MEYYGGVTLIMLFMAISFSSSNRAALAIRGSAQEHPIGYLFATKSYLKIAAVVITTFSVYFSPESKCDQLSRTNTGINLCL